MAADLWDSFDKETYFTDIAVITNEKPIYVHRIILHCRCPELLQELLETNGLKEFPSGNVHDKVQLVAPEILKYPLLRGLLEFIYCDTISLDLWKVLVRNDIAVLLSLASKYNLSKYVEIKFITFKFPVIL